MAIVDQLFDTQTTGKSASTSYTILGVETEAEARAALFEEAPLTLVANGRTVYRSDEDTELREVADLTFAASVSYKLPENAPREVGDFEITANVVGQSVRVTQARKHIGDYAPAGQTARTFKGGINFANGEFQGTEILVPFTDYTYSLTVDSSEVDGAYVARIGKLVGRVNSKTFHDWKPHELLLTRFAGTQRGEVSDGKTNLSWSFLVSNEETNLVVSGHDGNITIPKKRGWDYLWTYYDDRTITVGGKKYTHKVPISAHLEQVYLDADYSTIGI